MSRKLPVIAFFVYNRPEHTQVTLNRLMKNISSKKYNIYIFSDGPKKLKDEINVNKVRNFINKIKYFNKIKIIKQKKTQDYQNH